jgi:hypothetical protein
VFLPVNSSFATKGDLVVLGNLLKCTNRAYNPKRRKHKYFEFGYIPMTKKVTDSERIVVGWGNKGERRCFFITHKKLPETQGDPICCKPEDLEKKLMEVADKVDKIKNSQKQP